jgi:hypothetical protein
MRVSGLMSPYRPGAERRPSGCGGASGPMPDVSGDRLDVAKAKMDDAG